MQVRNFPPQVTEIHPVLPFSINTKPSVQSKKIYQDISRDKIISSPTKPKCFTTGSSCVFQWHENFSSTLTGHSSISLIDDKQNWTERQPLKQPELWLHTGSNRLTRLPDCFCYIRMQSLRWSS